MSIIAWIVIGLMLSGALGLLLAWGRWAPPTATTTAMGATTAERRCWFAPKSAFTSTRTGSRYRTSTAPARVGRRY